MPVDSDIRRWFLKQPHKKESTDAQVTKQDDPANAGKVAADSRPELKKTSKYFSGGATGTKAKSSEEDLKAKVEKVSTGTEAKPSEEDLKTKVEKVSPTKRKQQAADIDVVRKSGPSPKKLRSEDTGSNEASEITLSGKKDIGKDDGAAKGAGRGGGRAVPVSASEEAKPSPASRGRGGGGRGGYFAQPRAIPPHKGEKEAPQGAEDCLAGLTFVISGTLDSLEREEAEDLIKRHGGRITTNVSKKTSYLLADEDVGGRKSVKAKELGITFLSEDGLFDMIRSSKPVKTADGKQLAAKESGHKETEVQNVQSRKASGVESSSFKPASFVESVKLKHGESVSKLDKRGKGGLVETEAWPEKHKPKSSAEIIGNQSIVKELHDWLKRWDEQHLHGGQKGKKRGGGGNTSGGKKAVLLSGPPGIGKTTSARLISKELGFEALEVNASDNRGKADSKIGKGIGGSTANTIKEMVSNESLAIGNMDWNTNPHKSVLIMDEVDGMSGGDRGGVADLIASIKTSRIPIVCICNDRYSQKLKSLINYCLPLNFRKPTKQQMAKRLQQVALAEGMQVDEIALEELAEQVNGDMRMALNQLQYMCLQSQVIRYADMKARLVSSGKDEDMSPFNAVDKLMGYEGGRLRMDQRLDASMSDPDLVPLLIQENYLNYCPSKAGRDENGIMRMELAAHAAEAIANGDVVNVQIRRYRQWQHSQMAAFMSSIIPAALMHGRRETLIQGERNFNRFGAWLGKNSSFGKKLRLLEDVHVHLLASRLCNSTREAVRLDCVHVLELHLTDPLRTMPKESAVQSVINFMEEYSLTQEDFDSILDLSKFQGQPNPMESVQPAVKAALTKGYKQREHDRRVKSADLLPAITFPGQKKPPQKRAAKNLGPVVPLDDEDLLEDIEGLEDADEDGEDSSKDEGLAAFKEANGNMLVHLNVDNSKSGKNVPADGSMKGRRGSQASKTNVQRKSPDIKKAPETKGGKRKR